MISSTIQVGNPSYFAKILCSLPTPLSRFGRPFHSFPMLEVKSALKFRERMIILLLADQCCNAGWVLLMSYASQVVQAFSRQTVSSWLRVPVFCSPLSCWFPIATCWIYMAPEISPTTWICNPAPGAGLSGSHSQGLGRSTTLSNWLMNPQVEGELGFGQGFVRGGWSCFFLVVGSITGPMFYQKNIICTACEVCFYCFLSEIFLLHHLDQTNSSSLNIVPIRNQHASSSW